MVNGFVNLRTISSRIHKLHRLHGLEDNIFESVDEDHNSLVVEKKKF